ncbi:phytanoyl-CoA dioxygenase family protein [Methylocapsa aurea]|uniref:phytanoyl-CoA dioxygenase family protein n=1 Tax=Methylocapsa aurea TaxID=663610 RepID=UPI00056B9FCA|nr:phytanoyl-CoA dioxygenase family protein [Methylocapsa aurea]
MDWREEYRDQGFVVVENVLPHDLIDAHIVDVAALLRKYGVFDAAALSALPMAVDDELMVAVLDLHQEGEAARGLIFNRIIGSLLRQLFEAEPSLAFARSALWGPGDMRAHVDTAFRSPEPPYGVCRTWCALEDIHPESGRFYLLPGSHRSLAPKLCGEVLAERPDLMALYEQMVLQPQSCDAKSWMRLHNRAWPFVSAKVADRIEEAEKVAFQLNKGDIVFFNPSIAHGAFSCADASLTRKMMLCEWTANGASDFALSPEALRSCVRLPLRREDNLVDIGPRIAARAAR